MLVIHRCVRARGPSPASSLPPAGSPAPTLLGRLRSEGRGFLLGCLCLAASNVLGAEIPWLLKSAIDVLRGAHGALALEAARRAVTYTALGIVGCALLQAIIRTWSRMLIFNAGRNIEYRLRRDLFRPSGADGSGVLQAAPDGRPDVASDQRPRRRADAVRAGCPQPHQHAAHLHLHADAHAADQPAAHAVRAAALPRADPGRPRVHTGDVPREPRPAGTDRAHVDRRAGGSGRRRGGQAVRAGAAAPRRILARERDLPRALAPPGARARHAGPAVRDVWRRGHAHRPLAGWARGDSRPAHRRRPGGVQHLSGRAVLADHRARLGHLHVAARTGRVAARARHPGHAARDRRRR